MKQAKLAEEKHRKGLERKAKGERKTLKVIYPTFDETDPTFTPCHFRFRLKKHG